MGGRFCHASVSLGAGTTPILVWVGEDQEKLKAIKRSDKIGGSQNLLWKRSKEKQTKMNTAQLNCEDKGGGGARGEVTVWYGDPSPTHDSLTLIGEGDKPFCTLLTPFAPCPKQDCEVCSSRAVELLHCCACVRPRGGKEAQPTRTVQVAWGGPQIKHYCSKRYKPGHYHLRETHLLF